uniref:Uncharacterized protein n=1 Tax=Varanus komodoensis TaxID=61221 RepID=A0A8D2JEL3_VARKO
SYSTSDREQGLLLPSHRSLIEPKKLPNPVKESRHHRELHRELLFTHRRGLLPEHKPELQRVLEARRIRQLKQQEEIQKPLTDLEEELRKRQQKLAQVSVPQVPSPIHVYHSQEMIVLTQTIFWDKY